MNKDSKLYRYTIGLFLILVGIVVYLFTQNKDLLAKLMSAQTGQKSAVIDEKKAELERQKQALDRQAEEAKQKANESKKDLSPDEIEKFYKDK